MYNTIGKMLCKVCLFVCISFLSAENELNQSWEKEFTLEQSWEEQILPVPKSFNKPNEMSQSVFIFLHRPNIDEHRIKREAEGSGTVLRDIFVVTTIALKNREFTDQLNDQNSADFRTLSLFIRNNFDAVFSSSEYRGTNIYRFRQGQGSVIFEAEIVVFSNSPLEIISVLEESNTTGVIGNVSIIRNSINFKTNLPALTDITMEVKYSGFSGATLEIICNINGPFFPNFQWEKDTSVLSLSNRVKIEKNNQESRLFVRKTEKIDSGKYYCIVSKGENMIEGNVSVGVKVIPVVTVSPLFVSATEGDEIILECKVTQGNDQSVRITWNSEESVNINQARKLDLSKIRVSADQRYTASYWCVAESSDGVGRSQNVTVNIFSQGFSEFCLGEEESGYTWEKTAVGTDAIKNCPNGTTGTVTRSCTSGDPQPVWDEINSSNCRSTIVTELFDKVSRLVNGFKSENISDIMSETQHITSDQELYVKDVEDIVSILDQTKERTKTQDDRQNFIRTSSNIVNRERESVWEKIPSRNDLANQIISGVDLNARSFISRTIETGKVVSYNTPNIDVIGIRLPRQQSADPKKISLLNAGGGVIIPGSVTRDIQQVTVVKYSSIKDILSEEELKESVDSTIELTLVVIRSAIVSLTTEPKLNVTVAEPLKIVIQNNQSGYVNPKRTCAFIEPENRNSNWSSRGCKLNEAESNNENVTCDCDHNTAFAIMMDVADIEVTETERKILETISTVGCSISLLGITLTILVQGFYWKQVKSQRAKILISMCVAIGFTDIFAILEGVARDNSVFCKAVAALLHFSVLSAFGWMLCEGIFLYILLIRVFDKGRRKNWKIFNFIGWGIPFLIVAVSLGATQSDGYGTETSCWLSIENKVIWAFVGPAFIVILINTIVFVMVMRKMMNTRKIKDESNIGKLRAGVKASAIIFPVLGLTWIFGLLTFNRETLFFRYLFAIFNSAQGLLIFLFHCVFNNQMREIVRGRKKQSTRTSQTRNNKATRSVDNPADPSSSDSRTIGAGLNQRMARGHGSQELE